MQKFLQSQTTKKDKNNFPVVSAVDITGLVELKTNHPRGGSTLRAAYTIVDILNVLLDGKVHTLTEIAQEAERHRSTVQRYVAALSTRFPVETYNGGDKKGGVQFISESIFYSRILTRNQLALAAKLFMEADRAVLSGDELSDLEILIGAFRPKN